MPMKHVWMHWGPLTPPEASGECCLMLNVSSSLLSCANTELRSSSRPDPSDVVTDIAFGWARPGPNT